MRKHMKSMRRGLVRTLAVLAFAGALTLPTNHPTADSFDIGGVDGSFESGLGGAVITGNVVSASHLGTNVATHGGLGALLSTVPDSGATAADATVSTLRRREPWRATEGCELKVVVSSSAAACGDVGFMRHPHAAASDASPGLWGASTQGARLLSNASRRARSSPVSFPEIARATASRASLP